MKYVILRCEDEAPMSSRAVTLLEGARTPHLQQLAQAGAAGRIRAQRALRFDRFRLHRSLVGLQPNDPEAAGGACYAAGAKLQLATEDTAWCCDLVTQRDGTIIDPTAGRITTKESEVLIQALDAEMGSDLRRWEVGQDSHHVLVTGEPIAAGDGEASVRSSDLLAGEPWRRHLPNGPLGEALRRLIEEAATLLDAHPINRVRVDLGENPANLPWLWGRAGGTPRRTFKERTGRSGALVSDAFLTRGLAHALGLEWRKGPGQLHEHPLQQLMQTLNGLLARHDFLYVHVRVESADQVERLCLMERIDQLLLRPLTEALPRLGPWRLLAALDDRASGSVPFVAIGTGLPQQPVVSLSASHLEGSPLVFEDGRALFAWFTDGMTG